MNLHLKEAKHVLGFNIKLNHLAACQSFLDSCSLFLAKLSICSHPCSPPLSYKTVYDRFPWPGLYKAFIKKALGISRGDVSHYLVKPVESTSVLAFFSSKDISLHAGFTFQIVPSVQSCPIKEGNAPDLYTK